MPQGIVETPPGNSVIAIRVDAPPKLAQLSAGGRVAGIG
jgi:hypothetical protein